MKYKYKCTSVGSVNNKKKKVCNFEFEFKSGTYHCPLCGSPLALVPNGKSVSQILREGFEASQKK